MLCVADLLSQVPAPVHEGVGIWFFVVFGEIVGAEGGRAVIEGAIVCLDHDVGEVGREVERAGFSSRGLFAQR